MTTSEQARADRECSACGGTGEHDACGRDHGMTTCDKHNCCLCEQSFDDVRLNGATCPVCLGSGRISDRTPAADAIADAETLRFVAAETCGGDPYPLLTEQAKVAEVCALGEYGYAGNNWHNEAAYWALYAARAAFRAVPGLRG